MRILSILLLASLAFAQDSTRRTEITVNEPLLVAGVPQVTLQPGKYVLRQLSHEHSRNIVQIFDDKNKLVSTVLAINNYRLKPTGKTVLQYWETPTGNPPAIRAWFAPGDEWGQEFVYPKGLATRLARETGGPVLTARVTTEAELTSAPVTEVLKSGEEKPLEEAYVQEPASAQTQAPVAVPAPSQAPVAVPAPSQAPATGVAAQQERAPAVAQAPAEAQTPSTELLPETDSPAFAIALGGLLLAGVGYYLWRTVLHKPV
jgi:hypothetical protein